ncbi:MAG: choice-of-anchor D domain-containing protein [Deltaproteobacteria bacterium]|nr:choice-of-anchor D domain-containing protein [Deltaproteobacteria bacterium]
MPLYGTLATVLTLLWLSASSIAASFDAINLTQGSPAATGYNTFRDVHLNNAGQAAFIGSNPTLSRSDVFFWDGSALKNITKDDPEFASFGIANPSNLKLNQNGHLVFIGWAGLSFHVFLYDGVSLKNLSKGLPVSGANSFTKADLNDFGKVAFSGCHQSSWGCAAPHEVFLFDGSIVNTICAGTSNQCGFGSRIEAVVINNLGHVAWYGGTGYSGVGFFDGNSMRELTNDPVFRGAGYDYVSGLKLTDSDRLIFRGDKSLRADIFYSDAQSLINLTESDPVAGAAGFNRYDDDPALSNSGKAGFRAQQGSSNSTAEIFYFDGNILQNLTGSDPAAGGAGFNQFASPRINDAGALGFFGNKAFVANSGAIFLYDGLSLKNIVQGTSVVALQVPRINASGRAIFFGKDPLTTTERVRDIFFFDGTSLQNVTAVVPEVASRILFDHPIPLNDNDQILFPASNADGTNDVFLMTLVLPPVLSAEPTSLSFGEIIVGSSKDLTFTVQNTGSGTLTGSAAASAPFSIVGDNSFSLAANQSKAITVRFSPTTAGSFNSNLNVTSNGGNASPIVTGTGVLSDSDGDGLPDVYEIAHSLNPNDPSDANQDPDGDGLTNLQEFQLGTDPRQADTDGDGVSDGVEVSQGTDPLDASSFLVPPPTGLRATVGNERVYLDWDPSPLPVDGYNIFVERFDDNTQTFISLGTVNPPGILIQNTSFKVFGFANGDFVENGKLYRFKVTAVKNGVESSPSEAVLARPSEFAVAPAATRPVNPILFLHGINSNASTWDTTRDFFENTLHWRIGGILDYLETDDPRITNPLILNFHFDADFYTATFGNSLANYTTGRSGLLHQADEVQGFIRGLRIAGVTKKISIVAHSMGGMSARSYIADNPPEAVNEIAQFITYGSPHWGASFASLVQPFSQGAEDLDFDCTNGRLDYTRSPFMEHLRNVILPTRIRYFFIRGFVGRRILTQGCLSEGWDGVIPLDSADLGAIPRSAPVGQVPRIINTTRPLSTSAGHIRQTSDFSAILCGLDPGCFVAALGSPVDIQITAPDGRSIARQLAEIPGASYLEAEDETGHQIGTVIIPFPLPGDYTISVVPKDNASPTDTYTLEVSRNGTTTIIAQDQYIQDIPPQGFSVHVNAPPTANAGPDKTVRLGSVVTLNGGGSDPDNGPSPLSFAWTETAGPAVALNGANTATPTLTPSVVGSYTFSLIVNDGAADSAPDTVTITVPILGDIDLDGDVDVDDLKLLQAASNTFANGPNDLRDLNGDGLIDARDVPELVKRCTRPGCGPPASSHSP